MTFRKKLSVSLAVTSGIALTVGGLQFANAGGAEHQKAKAKAKETPSMVSAAFGDTEHLSEDEARKRLARQGKVVATAKKVRKDLKPGWSAGDYVDPKDGTLTVNVTSKRRAEDVDAPNVTPRVVSRSTTDLNAVKVSVDKLVERFTPSGVTYYIDVRKNVVTVEVARTMLDKGRTGSSWTRPGSWARPSRSRPSTSRSPPPPTCRTATRSHPATPPARWAGGSRRTARTRS